MLITSQDRLEPRAGEHAHVLKIILPTGRRTGQDNALAEHIDSFVRLYLSRFETRSLRASRTGPLRWAIVSSAQSMITLEQVRSELETALFGSQRGDDAGQIALIGQRVEEDEGEYIAAEPSTSAPAPSIVEEDEWTPAAQADEPLAPTGPEDTLRAELDAFRADMRAIAEGMKGPPIHDALDSFREGLEAFSAQMDARLSQAADRVEGAAERVDAATARLPDPDRLELALTRNDASAALITSGLQESLKLLLKAVEGLERQSAGNGADSHRAAA